MGKVEGNGKLTAQVVPLSGTKRSKSRAGKEAGEMQRAQRKLEACQWTPGEVGRIYTPLPGLKCIGVSIMSRFTHRMPRASLPLLLISKLYRYPCQIHPLHNAKISIRPTKTSRSAPLLYPAKRFSPASLTYLSYLNNDQHNGIIPRWLQKGNQQMA